MAVSKWLSETYWNENYFSYGTPGVASYRGALAHVAAPLSATSDTIVALGHYDDTEFTLTGDFTYGNLGTVSGTVTGYTISWEGEVFFEATGMKADASRFWASLLSDQMPDAYYAGFKTDDTFYGNSSNSYFYCGAGDDVAYGYKGSDTIYGNRGNDKLYGGDDGDRLYGGAGKDILDGGNGVDRLWGDEGKDKLVGGRGDDQLYAGGGADVVTAGKGNDQMAGDIDVSREYYQVLYSLENEDFHYEGHEQELLDKLAGFLPKDGETGADTFKFQKGDGNNVIFDFEALKDTIHITKGAKKFGKLKISEIDFYDYDQLRGFVVDNAISQVMPAVVDDLTLIEFSNVKILLADVLPTDLNASMFEFG